MSIRTYSNFRWSQIFQHASGHQYHTVSFAAALICVLWKSHSRNISSSKTHRKAAGIIRLVVIHLMKQKSIMSMKNIMNALLEKLVRIKQLGVKKKPKQTKNKPKLKFASRSKSFKASVYCEYCQSISKNVKKSRKEHKAACSHNSSLSFRMWSLS